MGYRRGIEVGLRRPEKSSFLSNKILVFFVSRQKHISGKNHGDAFLKKKSTVNKAF